MFNLPEMASKFLNSTRTKFAHDRSKTVGSSEIGTCARMVAAKKLGVTPDAEYKESVGFSGRGNNIENGFAAPLMAFVAEELGGKLLYAEQDNQVSLVAEGVPLSATPDGLVVDVPRNALSGYGVDDLGPSNSFGLEIKSIDPRYNMAKLPKPAHTPQVIAAQGLMRRASEHKPDFSLLFYVDASDYTNIAGFNVPYSDSAFKALVKRADRIMKATDYNAFLPEGKINGGGDCKYCPIAKRCLGYLPMSPGDDAAPAKVKQLDAVVKAAKAYAAKQTKVALAEQAERDAEAKLALTLSGAGTRFVKHGGATVVWTNTPSQERADTAAMKARLIALGEDVTKFVKPTKPGVKLKVELH